METFRIIVTLVVRTDNILDKNREIKWSVPAHIIVCLYYLIEFCVKDSLELKKITILMHSALCLLFEKRGNMERRSDGR